MLLRRGNVETVTAVRRLRDAAVPLRGVPASPVRLLTDADLPAVHAHLNADPIACAVVQARIEREGTLTPQRLGAEMVGVDALDGGLAACCYNGGNLVPISGSAQDLQLIAHYLEQRPRNCTSIVGRDTLVSGLWQSLSHRWLRPRAIREVQPLLLTSVVPTLDIAAELRLAQHDDVEHYVTAAAAMFTEELGVSPYRQATRSAYRQRVEALISARRALVITDRRGVVFKAEMAAVTEQTCQIQGVWVRPKLRGQGIATAAMSGVLAHALQLAPSASLYVNDFNSAACRLYERLGMQQVATISTILL